MKDPDKALRGIDWSAIFKRRPDLEPPGYRETVSLIYSKGVNDESTARRDA
jgi:hypothetical protein